MSKVILKTPEKIALMREAGQLLARVFDYLDAHIDVGITTMAINDLAERFIVDELNARPASKGQYDYPFVLNSSVNQVVCHGVPSDKQRLKSGDSVNIDITLEKAGFIADSSKMYAIGKVSPIAQRLIDTTYAAMWRGIQQVKPGAYLGDIGHAIESFASKHGYSVVKEYCGHGIGREMHEGPEVLHYGKPHIGLRLEKGMVFTIEPMINQGKAKVKLKKDGWTVVTSDKKLSAQWEHTIAVTDDGFEVLTLRTSEAPFFG